MVKDLPMSVGDLVNSGCTYYYSGSAMTGLCDGGYCVENSNCMFGCCDIAICGGGDCWDTCSPTRLYSDQ